MEGAPDERRWVFVEDSPFLPVRGGGEREHLGMLRAARAAGALAAVVLPAEGPVDIAPYRAELGAVPLLVAPRRTSPLLLLHPRLPYVVASRPVPPTLVADVAAVAPGATGIVVSSYKSWQLGRALAEGLGLPAVLRMHNREGAYHRALATGTSGPRGAALGWEARRIESDEVEVGRAAWVTGIADISAADAAWRRTTTATPVEAIPPFALAPAAGVDAEAGGPDAPGREPSTVLFLGALDVATNVTALGWLLDLAWPAVRRVRPDATLLVVGRSPGAEVRASVARAEGVELYADVPQVAPFLARASVAVNPAVSGSGVNIKLVEYLEAGLPS